MPKTDSRVFPGFAPGKFFNNASAHLQWSQCSGPDESLKRPRSDDEVDEGVSTHTEDSQDSFQTTAQKQVKPPAKKAKTSTGVTDPPPTENARPRAKRAAFTAEQVEVMQNRFSICTRLSYNEYDDIAMTIGLKATQVRNWFQNQRSKLNKLQKQKSNTDIEAAAHEKITDTSLHITKEMTNNISDLIRKRKKQHKLSTIDEIYEANTTDEANPLQSNTFQANENTVTVSEQLKRSLANLHALNSNAESADQISTDKQLQLIDTVKQHQTICDQQDVKNVDEDSNFDDGFFDHSPCADSDEYNFERVYQFKRNTQRSEQQTCGQNQEVLMDIDENSRPWQEGIVVNEDPKPEQQSLQEMGPNAITMATNFQTASVMSQNCHKRNMQSFGVDNCHGHNKQQQGVISNQENLTSNNIPTIENRLAHKDQTMVNFQNVMGNHLTAMSDQFQQFANHSSVDLQQDHKGPQHSTLQYPTHSSNVRLDGSIGLIQPPTIGTNVVTAYINENNFEAPEYLLPDEKATELRIDVPYWRDQPVDRQQRMVTTMMKVLSENNVGPNPSAISAQQTWSMSGNPHMMNRYPHAMGNGPLNAMNGRSNMRTELQSRMIRPQGTIVRSSYEINDHTRMNTSSAHLMNMINEPSYMISHDKTQQQPLMSKTIVLNSDGSTQEVCVRNSALEWPSGTVQTGTEALFYCQQSISDQGHYGYTHLVHCNDDQHHLSTIQPPADHDNQSQDTKSLRCSNGQSSVSGESLTYRGQSSSESTQTSNMYGPTGATYNRPPFGGMQPRNSSSWGDRCTNDTYFQPKYLNGSNTLQHKIPTTIIQNQYGSLELQSTTHQLEEANQIITCRRFCVNGTGRNEIVEEYVDCGTEAVLGVAYMDDNGAAHSYESGVDVVLRIANAVLQTDI